MRENDDWDKRILAVIRIYREHDEEAAHGDEDELLEEFVRLRASDGDPLAKALIPLLDLDRSRWYA